MCSFIKGGAKCQKEMEQDHLVKDRGQEEVWEVAVEAVEWAAIGLVQAPAEIAYAPTVNQPYLIR